MTGEPSQAPVEASAPSATASDALPFSVWLLFGLGALSCATWIGAVMLDLWAPTSNLAPIWLWRGLHAALILAVPALILLFGRSPAHACQTSSARIFRGNGAPRADHCAPRPAPHFSASFSRSRQPATACTYAQPRRGPRGGRPAGDRAVAAERFARLLDSASRWSGLRRHRDHRRLSSPSSSSLARRTHTCADGGGLGCGSLIGRMMITGCGGGFLFALPGLFGALLGYAIGAWVARADSW